MVSDDQPDWDAALLTEAQREYLKGNKEYRPSVERDVRKRIRDRLRATLVVDLRLLLDGGVKDGRINHDQILSEIDLGQAWPLATLLFLWASYHPTFTDREDFEESLRDTETDPSPQIMTTRTAKSFDRAVESGVEVALEYDDTEYVPLEIENDLTVSLGESVSDMSEEEIADLPRRTVDRLFRDGDLDMEQYACVMERKLGRVRSEEEP